MKKIGFWTVLMLLLTSFAAGAYVALGWHTGDWTPRGIMLGCLIGIGMLWIGYLVRLMDERNS